MDTCKWNFKQVWYINKILEDADAVSQQCQLCIRVYKFKRSVPDSEVKIYKTKLNSKFLSYNFHRLINFNIH